MSKRFTATEKWDEIWFSALSLKHKCLWFYLCDKCDAAGVWEPNWKIATAYIGQEVTGRDLEPFGSRVTILPNGKVLLNRFIHFQNGELSQDCRPHIHILRLMVSHKLDISGKITVSTEKSNPSPTLSLPLPNPSVRVVDKDQDKDQDKEGESEGKQATLFEEPSLKYPHVLDTSEFRAAFDGWRKWRTANFKKLKEPMATWQHQLKFLADLGCAENAIQSISQSIRNGWQGLFPPKGHDGKPLPIPIVHTDMF